MRHGNIIIDRTVYVFGLCNNLLADDFVMMITVGPREVAEMLVDDVWARVQGVGEYPPLNIPSIPPCCARVQGVGVYSQPALGILTSDTVHTRGFANLFQFCIPAGFAL